LSHCQKSGTEYTPAVGTTGRASLLATPDMLNVADPASGNLGYGVGAGAYRLSPHAITTPERFGPLTWADYTATVDPYVSDVFNITITYQQGQFSGKHDGFRQATFERSEFCSACHDVTNPLIERTYTEWRSSRYADRPGNGEPHPPYDSSPPTSGPRLSYIADWGPHALPVPLELQAHNLEHGGVLLQYNCPHGCPDVAGRLDALARIRDGVLSAPYPFMPPGIALTAWGHLERLDRYDEEAIVRFIGTYAGVDHHLPPTSPHMAP